MYVTGQHEASAGRRPTGKPSGVANGRDERARGRPPGAPPPCPSHRRSRHSHGMNSKGGHVAIAERMVASMVAAAGARPLAFSRGVIERASWSRRRGRRLARRRRASRPGAQRSPRWPRPAFAPPRHVQPRAARPVRGRHRTMTSQGDWPMLRKVVGVPPRRTFLSPPCCRAVGAGRDYVSCSGKWNAIPSYQQW